MKNHVNNERIVRDIAHLLNEHRGEDTIALKLGEASNWTDYFVITTVRSNAHLAGLIRQLHQFLRTNGILPRNPVKGATNAGWVLIDCGDFVVHLMDAEKREFYELERIWYRSNRIYQSSNPS